MADTPRSAVHENNLRWTRQQIENSLRDLDFGTSEGAREVVQPTGQTDDQGYFTLTSYSNSDGAPEGKYAVTVTWFRIAPSGKNDVFRYNALPPRFASPQTSALQVTIDKDTKELPPLQLFSR